MINGKTGSKLTSYKPNIRGSSVESLWLFVLSNWLKKLGFSSGILADPVLSDQVIAKKWKLLKSLDSRSFDRADFEWIDFQGKKIGIAMRQLKWNSYKKRVRELLEYIVQCWWKLVYLPHSFHKTDELANDYCFLWWFQEKIKWKITHSMEETYNVYTAKKIDMLIGQRLHSMILAQVYGIEYVWLSYSDKTKIYLESAKK